MKPARSIKHPELATACFGAIVAAVSLAGCHREPTPPAPQSRQRVAAEAERRAATIEAEMNNNADSESIAKKPEARASQPPARPQPQGPPPQPPPPQ